VDELKEAQVKRQLVLGDSPVGPRSHERSSGQNPPQLYDHGYPFPVGVVDTRDIHSLAVLVSVMAESREIALSYAA
jgi:hypothetical protein